MLACASGTGRRVFMADRLAVAFSLAGVVAPAVVASTAPSGIALPTVMVSRPPMAEADPSGTGSVSSVVASTVTRTSLGSITGR